jgi:hypothetical protein
MRKGTHKVSFKAHKEVVAPVKFKTKDGETISFKAHKEVEQRVTFFAKNEPHKSD